MHRTLGIILKKQEWREADYLVTALTARFGKIRLRVQGVRKLGAKLQGHLELYVASELGFVVGRNSYRLVGARLENFFLPLRLDLSTLAAAAIMAEAVDENLLESHETAGAFFNLLERSLQSLETLASRPSPPRAAEVNFILDKFHREFLTLLGVARSDSDDEVFFLYQRARQSVRLPRAIFVS